MLNKIDVISDIHLDFWVRMQSNSVKMNKHMDEFILKLLPAEPSNILLIAGDLGHYNKQNLIFLEKLSAIYKHILLVAGNHDYYMISKNIVREFKLNSLLRWNNMQDISKHLSNVHYLNGDIIEFEGVKIGGTSAWYDFSYGQVEFGASKTKIYNLWNECSNDSNYIYGLPRDTMAMFENEKEKIKTIVKESDIIMTHVSPDWSKLPSEYMLELTNSFYYFNGKDLLKEDISYLNNKIWLSGHTHVRNDYMKYDCWFINAALGYPGESSKRKIVTIDI